MNYLYNPYLLLHFLVLLIVFALLGADQSHSAEYKRQRLELASTFHPADEIFSSQLQKFLAIVEKNNDTKLTFRRSRNTRGSSPRQTVQLLNTGSIDGVLLDPVGLGYQPAIAQIFGGIPFGPDASQIIAWSESAAGRSHVVRAFQGIGAHALLCGHSDSRSGVFARNEFHWPAPARSLTVHSRGLADDTYRNLNVATRSLPAGDLYMGYASGVVDLLVSYHPSMDARAGFAQVSDYFYYPSWERSSAFALLLLSQKKWQTLSASSRALITEACKTLNHQPLRVEMAGTIASIATQGANGTIVKVWPPQFLEAAQQMWKVSATRAVSRHPSLAPAFEALNVTAIK